MTLPIGTTNTQSAIREIAQPPPSGEDPDSPMGRSRYYNLVDMILVVANSGLSATSVKYGTLNVPASQLAKWVTTTNSFADKREGKTVRSVDIDVGTLAAWSKTNGNLNAALGGFDKLSSLYVLDNRTLTGTNLAAVRLKNGANLPTTGLTVATHRPLYVWGALQPNEPGALGHLQHLDHPAGFTGIRCDYDSVHQLERHQQHQSRRFASSR